MLRSAVARRRMREHARDSRGTGHLRVVPRVGDIRVVLPEPVVGVGVGSTTSTPSSRSRQTASDTQERRRGVADSTKIGDAVAHQILARQFHGSKGTGVECEAKPSDQFADG